MDKLKKIPVIGYLIRLLVAIVKLPKHIDGVYKFREEQIREQQSILSIKQKQEIICNQIEHLDAEIKELQCWNADRVKEIQVLQQSDDELRNSIDNLQSYIEELRRWNTDRMKEIQKLEVLDVDQEYFEKLNMLLSVHKTQWGNQKRLEISELAAVDSCLFNTNSGNIVIGDYTFAGSNVSIIAGSHDKRLTNFLRRDAEFTEECDIKIGKGVWLAANSTILGPATIDDNAVVAAGAVITPGTHIPANTIYGGVPAKQIGVINVADITDIHDDSILDAVKRNQGVLFVDGWSEKCLMEFGDEVYQGHIMTGEKALIYSLNKKIKLFYKLDAVMDQEIKYMVDGQNHKALKLSPGIGEICLEIDDNLFIGNSDLHVITIEKKLMNSKLFITLN